jgi:hypothetical protein
MAVAQGGGFRADANAIFAASVRFLDMKNYLSEVQGGLIGDLGPTGGMAGDDDAGRNFGSACSPAAQTTVRGIGIASAGCAAISANLLGMAWNYLLADDAAAASLIGGGPQLNSAMAPGPQECEPSNATITAGGAVQTFLDAVAIPQPLPRSATAADIARILNDLDNSV